MVLPDRALGRRLGPILRFFAGIFKCEVSVGLRAFRFEPAVEAEVIPFTKTGAYGGGDRQKGTIRDKGTQMVFG